MLHLDLSLLEHSLRCNLLCVFGDFGVHCIIFLFCPSDSEQLRKLSVLGLIFWKRSPIFVFNLKSAESSNLLMHQVRDVTIDNMLQGAPAYKVASFLRHLMPAHRAYQLLTPICCHAEPKVQEG